jgi:hypothetical protein
LGLRHYLDFVVTSRECGFEKPDKKIFREAILVSGVGDGTFLHVGDHPINDFEGPKVHTELYITHITHYKTIFLFLLITNEAVDE